MKRYFYLIFFPIALIAQTATAPSSGDGSSGDPYQIATLNNLYWITQNSGEWDANDDRGKPVSAGIYLYQIKAGEFVQTRKMVLLK